MNSNLVIPAIAVDAWKKKQPAKKEEEKETGNGKKNNREPGAVDAKLRKRMGDALADIFDAVGTKAYQNIIASAADKMATDLAAHSKELRSQIMLEHGKTGLRQAVEYIHEWATTIAHDIMENAPDQITEKVEAAIRGNFEAKDEAPPEGEGMAPPEGEPEASAPPAEEEAPKEEKGKKEAAVVAAADESSSDDSKKPDEKQEEEKKEEDKPAEGCKATEEPAPKEAVVAETKKEGFSKTRERAVGDLTLMEQALQRFANDPVNSASKRIAQDLAKKTHRVARHLKKAP